MSCKPVVSVPFTSFEASVPQALEAAGLGSVLTSLEPGRAVMCKPNLVNATPPPVTTPPACVEALTRWVRAHCDAPIVIAEGCGDAMRETPEIFEALGYADLAARLDADLGGVTLLDLNHAPLRRVARDDCTVFPEMLLPEAALDAFLVSVPVLKRHSLARMTGSLKNMMGLAPPEHYGGGGGWKKSSFHLRMQASVADLARHRAPDFTLMDASVGMAEYHLGGPECDPPLATLLAGFDAREVDREGARLLGLDWKSVGHLRP